MVVHVCGSRRWSSVPNVHSRSSVLASQDVASLAVLMASACRVQATAAASGTATRIAVHARVRRPDVPGRFSGAYASAGTIQNTAVVGFTSSPTRPATSASAPGKGRPRSRQRIVAHAKPTAPAVARYSIREARAQMDENGVSTNATRAAAALMLPAIWRTSP